MKIFYLGFILSLSTPIEESPKPLQFHEEFLYYHDEEEDAPKIQAFWIQDGYTIMWVPILLDDPLKDISFVTPSDSEDKK